MKKTKNIIIGTVPVTEIALSLPDIGKLSPPQSAGRRYESGGRCAHFPTCALKSEHNLEQNAFVKQSLV